IKDISDIKNELELTDDLSNRTVYINSKFNSAYETAVLYATKLVSRYIKKNNNKDALLFLKYAAEDVGNFTKKETAKEYATIINQRLDEFGNSSDDEIKKLAKEIKEKYNSFCWS
ncbi:MAG: hypothetical protein Q8S39_09670, partial [Ignavibacteria bacterium]|nr:hypothetical protein [Ignavibacteria bacterium]